MGAKKKLPAWFASEFSPDNLRGIRNELKALRNWTDGYNAAKGNPLHGIVGTGMLGGPNRAIILIDRLLEASQ